MTDLGSFDMTSTGGSTGIAERVPEGVPADVTRLHRCIAASSWQNRSPVSVIALVPLLPASAEVGDPSATRTVYITIVALIALGVGLGALTLWLVRRTRPEPQLLAPLEEMETRAWRKQDPAGQRRALDASRPAGARPVRREAAEPAVDTDFAAARPVVSFDDLADSDLPSDPVSVAEGDSLEDLAADAGAGDGDGDGDGASESDHDADNDADADKTADHEVPVDLDVDDDAVELDDALELDDDAVELDDALELDGDAVELDDDAAELDDALELDGDAVELDDTESVSTGRRLLRRVRRT